MTPTRPRSQAIYHDKKAIPLKERLLFGNKCRGHPSITCCRAPSCGKCRVRSIHPRLIKPRPPHVHDPKNSKLFAASEAEALFFPRTTTTTAQQDMLVNPLPAASFGSDITTTTTTTTAAATTTHSYYHYYYCRCRFHANPHAPRSNILMT